MDLGGSDGKNLQCEGLSLILDQGLIPGEAGVTYFRILKGWREPGRLLESLSSQRVDSW